MQKAHDDEPDGALATVGVEGREAPADVAADPANPATSAIRGQMLDMQAGANVASQRLPAASSDGGD